MRTLLRALGALVLVAGGLTATLAPASAASPYTSTIEVESPSITLGQKVQIAGRVTGGPVTGKYVNLFSRNGSGSWKSLGSAKLGSNGRWNKIVKPTKGGPTQFRAIKPAGSGHGQGTGYLAEPLNVFKWKNLSTYRVSTTTHYGDTTVNGTNYDSALLLGGTGGSDFTTSNGRCKRIKGSVGVTGTSTSDTGTLYATDGFLAFLFSIGAFEDRDVVGFTATVDPTKDLSLFATFSSPSGSDALAVVGAQVLCNQN